MNERASRCLAAFFPAQDEAATHEDQNHYSDSDVMEISSLLKQTRGAWSRVPRLYIVLRIIGQLHRLDDFIDLGFTDYWFPLKSKSLPDFLGPTDKANFMHAQSLVLTQASDLENGEIGRHRNFDSKESIPFESRGDLGHGAFGGVDKVVSLVSRKIYARKLIYRRALFPFPRAAQTMAAYVSELEILKRLKHRHAVELVGSYTDQSTLGLIMTPVADCNLAEYLTLAGSPDAVDRKSHLRNFFGCLTTALEYLHDSKIRHKDIKPQNILIKRHNVLLTDFGLARDLVDASGGTTEGATPLTPKYCAPEVGNYEPRNYSSDIWSLGCVFLEMVTIIKGESLAAQKTFFENNGTKETYFRLNVEAIKRWTTKLEMQGLFSDNVPIDWISRMLSENRNDRPTAQALLRDILNYRPTRDSVSSFCGTCCKTSDEAMEDVEYDEQSLFVSDEQSLFVSQTASSTAVESSATGSRAPAPQDVDMPDVSNNRDVTVLGMAIQHARYFVIKSTHELDVESSIAFNTWVSSKKVNGILDRAFSGRKGPVLLFFSIIGSKKFCGVAEMMSLVDPTRTDDFWAEDKWKGKMDVRWIVTADIDFKQVEHLTAKESINDSKEMGVTHSRDGQELCWATGREILTIFESLG